MPAGISSHSLNFLARVVVVFLSVLTAFAHSAAAAPSGEEVKRNNNPLNINWGPAPSPEDGPPGARNALRDPAYLPAQIGGIVGSYALSLVLVAIILLSLAKKRREHLNGADELWEEPSFLPLPGFQSQEEIQQLQQYQQFAQQEQPYPYPTELPKSPYRNFSHPSSPTSALENNPYIFPSPAATLRGAPGVAPQVDQQIVYQDRIMAQAQLEEMYKYVMEQEAAKEAGVEYQSPVLASPVSSHHPNKSTSTLVKKERNKPANLNLGEVSTEKTQSRTSSIFSALRSPRKKKMQGISISSPIMTPMSGTFPPQTGEEMDSIPPRQYAPAKPPPIPLHQMPYGTRQLNGLVSPVSPVSPTTPTGISPDSTQSIDERIGVKLSMDTTHTRNTSGQTEPDPISAATDTSTTPLVGLPTSPKPGVNRFPSLASLPSSPKPGATFSRPNAPSAVRTGGALPLRAYEPSLLSPTSYDRQMKQTTFERAPLSPGLGTARTPYTGAAVPYTPYQPFSPVIPMTPSLVTREDRKRMKKMVPKTPTMEMVRSSEDIW